MDQENLASKLGTTGKGIAYAYADKAARVGIQAQEYFPENGLKDYLWSGELAGKILCEGAQGVWLDLDLGNYPYVTSSTTLPYGACSLGFPPQKIRHVFGVAKIYDTRSGQDPDFPDTLLEDPILAKIGALGKEFGVTTGRRRKVNWLNLDKLVESINLTGTTLVIINKCDILSELGIFQLTYENREWTFESFVEMRKFLIQTMALKCPMLRDAIFSFSPEKNDEFKTNSILSR